MLQSIPILGHFTIPGQTQSAGTAIVQGIPPYAGPSGQPGQPYTYLPRTGVVGVANWLKQGAGAGAYTVVTYLEHLMGSTVHTLTFLRPLNFTTVSGAVAKNATAITLYDDPGVYSTNYRYPTQQAAPGTVADNAIAAGDFVAVPLANGAWLFDKIASGTFGGGNLVLTTGTPNVNGGTIADGAPFFFFGVLTDKDPATGYVHPQTAAGVATTREVRQDNVCGLVSTLRPGDPMIFHNANASNASTLGLIAGVYARF